MKVHLRDRITAGLGVGVLAAVTALSYYYSIHTETEALRAEILRESPDFTSTNAVGRRAAGQGQCRYGHQHRCGRDGELYGKRARDARGRPQQRADAL